MLLDLTYVTIQEILPESKQYLRRPEGSMFMGYTGFTIEWMLPRFADDFLSYVLEIILPLAAKVSAQIKWLKGLHHHH
jgi:hypothetical protein